MMPDRAAGFQPGLWIVTSDYDNYDSGEFSLVAVKYLTFRLRMIIKA